MFKYITTAILTVVLGVNLFAAKEPVVGTVKNCPKAAAKADCKKGDKACPKAAKGCPKAAKACSKAVLPQCAKVVKADSNDMVTWYKDSTGKRYLVYTWAKPAVVFARSFAQGGKVLPGAELMTVAPEGRSKGKIKNSVALKVVKVGVKSAPA